jgi:peptidoglycan L-alanyl-D-glutamate endopeptidase CwlK
MFKLSENSKQHRDGVDPRLIEISDLAITISLVDFGHGPDAGRRTDTRQHELFLEGASRADGYVHRGKHQADPTDGLGKALDFYAYVDGHASWAPAHLTMVACAFLQAASMLGYKITWGGLWRSKNPEIINGIVYGWDLPHIQLLED